MASTYTSIEELNAFPDGGSVDNSLLAVHIAGSQTYKMTVSDFNQKSTESAQHYAELAEEAYDGSVAIQQAIQASTTAATTAATNAGISEANAAASETAAATAAQEAAASATSLANAVTSARNSANAALSYEEGAEDAATLARSWAEGGTNTRQGENTNNAEYWAQYAERYAQGGLHYKGSIPFADIPTTGMREGDMYNITDDFTTDSRFEEGAGIEVKGGTNIAWNSDNKWDVLAIPPKTTFNGRSGSILPMAGDYDSEKILLTSVLHIGGETQDNVQEALEALENNKADRVDGAVADNFAGLDANGNLKDSGKKASDFATPSDIAGQQSLLKDTVGWTGKNRLKNTATTQTINGVTFTVNSDGSVTANGTASANASVTIATYLTLPTDIIGQNVILTGCPEGGSTNGKYFMNAIGFRSASSGDTDTGSGVQINNVYDFTANTATKIYIEVRSGYNAQNLTFYPMLRKADITDPTYEPYHESVEEEIEQIYADNGVLGAKNLLENTASTTTVNGVTFTVNADKSVTVNGTATADATIKIAPNSSLRSNLKEGISYILSGCPGGGSSSTYALQYSNNTNNVKYDTGSGVEFVDYDRGTYPNVSVYILIRSGVTASNLTFKPMIRLASDPDDTYQPYAMTNRELTEIKVYDANSAGFSAPNVTIDWTKSTMKKCGNICYFGFLITANNAISQYATVIQLPDEMKSKEGTRFMPTGTYPCVMSESGNIYAANTISQGSSSWYLSGTYII